MRNSEFPITASSIKRRQWLTAVLLLSVFFVFYTTLYPFDFILADPQTWHDVLASFNLNLLEAQYLNDIPRNIVLFVPFGFALGGLLTDKLKNSAAIFLLTLFIGLLLSFFVEVLQSHSLFRHPTLTDVLANGLGAGLGFVLYRVMGARLVHGGARIMRELRPFLTPRHTVIFFSLYIALFIWLSIQAQKQTQLSNWDTSYPLVIGNETTGNRGWRGAMTDLFMMDRALSPTEVAAVFNGTSAHEIDAEHLVAFYDFVGEGAVNFPALQWQGTPDPALQTEGVFLAQGQWLQSAEPVTQISQALRDSAQFTLAARFAVDRFDKSGPRRIVSISQGTGMRNITLGQEKHDLVLRLRLPMTNLNGRFPQFVIPNFFVDKAFHEMIMTYDGAQLIIYVDDPANAYRVEVAPAIALFNLAPPNELEQIPLSSANWLIFYVLYDALILVPFAALLLFIYGRLSWPKLRKISLLILLMVGFAFVWEGILSFFLDSYTITLVNAWLNLLIGLAALAFFALWHWGWRRQAKQT